MSKEKEENPSAFKHWISPALVKKIADAVTSAYPAFNAKAFSKISKDLKDLELKPRVLLIRDSLHMNLPADYPKAVKILLKAVDNSKLSGFDLCAFTEFVQTYGLDHFEISMKALYQLTQKFTAEFAVRPFIVKYPKETFSLLLKWSEDPSEHIRRWTSEGSRPRLPWGMKLHGSIKDPKDGIKILSNLKFDESLYVRKSIANHLNDIAKDHPDLVIQTLKVWRKGCPEKHLAKLDWIQKQALRSLIKAGYKPALKLMGYGEDALIKVGNLKLNKKKFLMNDVIAFEIEMTSTIAKAQTIAIDYVIHFQKANKKLSPKVFKLKVIELKGKETFVLKKNHPIRPVTTRKHYPGLHKIEIQINGNILASADWHLMIRG